jgi:hypothetical protein
MNKQNHIKELERQIQHVKEAPVKYFLGRFGKAWKIDRLERKIKELNKGHKNGDNKKGS